MTKITLNTKKQSNRKQYEEDLAKRQAEHLKRVGEGLGWQPCLHERCPLCHGTGVRLDGSMCIHHLSCSCPKCTPRY
jgi:hypothetical protein